MRKTALLPDHTALQTDCDPYSPAEILYITKPLYLLQQILAGSMNL